MRSSGQKGTRRSTTARAAIWPVLIKRLGHAPSSANAYPPLGRRFVGAVHHSRELASRRWRDVGDKFHNVEVDRLRAQFVHRSPIVWCRSVRVADDRLESPALEALEALLGPVRDTMLDHGQCGQITGVEQPPWQRTDWSQRLPLCL